MCVPFHPLPSRPVFSNDNNDKTVKAELGTLFEEFFLFKWKGVQFQATDYL